VQAEGSSRTRSRWENGTFAQTFTTTDVQTPPGGGRRHDHDDGSGSGDDHVDRAKPLDGVGACRGSAG